MNTLSFESLASSLIDCLHTGDLGFSEIVKHDAQHDLGRVFSALMLPDTAGPVVAENPPWHIVSPVPSEQLRQLKLSSAGANLGSPVVSADVRAGRIGIHYMLITLRWSTWEHRMLIPIASNDVAQFIAQFREHGVVCTLTNTPVFGMKNGNAVDAENMDAAFLRIAPSCMSARLGLLAQATNGYDDELYPPRLVATEALIVAIQALEVPGSVSTSARRRVTVSVACRQLQAEFVALGVLDNGGAT